MKAIDFTLENIFKKYSFMRGINPVGVRFIE